MLAVLHVVASINARTGGPAASVPGLASALVGSGVRSSVASLDYAEHGKSTAMPGVTAITAVPNALGKRLRGWSPTLGAAIGKAASTGIDVIHHHGLWMYPGIYARRTANRLDVPLVISPRGMLDAWALGRGVLRKTVAAYAYERRNLGSARLLHATSELEADAIRHYGLEQPIAVVPNGIDVPEVWPTSRAALEARFPRLKHRRWLLYMGRLHPKKGLDLLIDAWRSIASDFPAWQLVIAGPDLTGYASGLEATIAGDPRLRDRITITGMLEGGEKRCALNEAELFVLPTRAENFGIAVAEALAHGLPVVTTTAAPWSDIVSERCGWWVAPESQAIEDALRCAMRLTPDQLRMRGECGRRYVAAKLAWNAIGDKMASVYGWLVAGGTTPACVRER